MEKEPNSGELQGLHSQFGGQQKHITHDIDGEDDCWRQWVGFGAALIPRVSRKPRYRVQCRNGRPLYTCTHHKARNTTARPSNRLW